MLKTYPEKDGYIGGCKVSWFIYKDRAVAEECSKVAVSNARQLAAQGYDFGYQAPGEIKTTKDGRFSVCIP